jgi:sugar O-acyltransferase (sialic acid O-acetyltransferase NeuD family)
VSYQCDVIFVGVIDRDEVLRPFKLAELQATQHGVPAVQREQLPAQASGRRGRARQSSRSAHVGGRMGGVDAAVVLVLGAGGHGKSVVAVLLASGRQVVGVLDDSAPTWATQLQGVPVLGPIAELPKHPSCDVLIGLGENDARRKVAALFPQARWTRLVHPGAYVNPTARLGAGTVVFPSAVIGADAVLGAHVIVSSHTTVGHDTVLEDFAQLAPGVQVAGGAHVGSGAMLGIGSIVCPGVRIGENATLAAGAVAVRDIPAGCTAFGVPARRAQARDAD